MSRKKRRKKELRPQLICVQEPHKNCNDGLYVVRIPTHIFFDKELIGVYQEFKFIGLRQEAHNER